MQMQLVEMRLKLDATQILMKITMTLLVNINSIYICKINKTLMSPK